MSKAFLALVSNDLTLKDQQFFHSVDIKNRRAHQSITVKGSNHPQAFRMTNNTDKCTAISVIHEANGIYSPFLIRNVKLTQNLLITLKVLTSLKRKITFFFLDAT